MFHITPTPISLKPLWNIEYMAKPLWKIEDMAKDAKKDVNYLGKSITQLENELGILKAQYRADPTVSNAEYLIEKK